MAKKKKNTKENEDARNLENGVALSLSSTPARFSHQFSRSGALKKLHLSVLSLSLCISGSKMPTCFDTLYKLHQQKFCLCNLKPIESLNNVDDDGSENVAKIIIGLLSNFYCVYFDPLNFSTQGILGG